MRLPSGPMDGALPIERVLHVLEEHGVNVRKVDDDAHLLKSDDFVEVQYFGDLVPRLLIRHLGHVFDVDPFLFYYDDYDDGPPEQG